MERLQVNERIQKLADQAGFIRFSPEEDPHTPIDWSSDYTYELEKFAELIVQECVNVLHDNELWNRHISHALKEHFGVEE